MVVLGINGNHIAALSELNDKLNMEDYFEVQITYDELDSRSIVARWYKWQEPGWIEYHIDQNGTVTGETTGGLD